jgi:hypothetical protein
MAYVKEIFKSKDKKIMIVKKHHAVYALPEKEKVKQKRIQKQNGTDETQEKINERLRKEKYMRLLADNFKAGDFYLTLTTKEKITAEEFKQAMKNFMKRFRREYEKRTGEKIKYFRVMENLQGNGRPHAHMIVPAFCSWEIARGLITAIWQEGFCEVKPYNGEATDAFNISSYFTKQGMKEKGAKIDTSRGNLIRREPKKEIIHAETFSDDIKPPKGYRVVKPLSFNTYTAAGYPYQIAVFQKIEEYERSKVE